MNLKDKLYKWLEYLATIRLDDVSSLQRMARDGYKYIENTHEMIIQVEMQSGKPDVIIYSSTLKGWLTPYENEIISVEKKQQILDKLCRYLDGRKFSYKIA